MEEIDNGGTGRPGLLAKLAALACASGLVWMLTKLPSDLAASEDGVYWTLWASCFAFLLSGLVLSLAPILPRSVVGTSRIVFAMSGFGIVAVTVFIASHF